MRVFRKQLPSTGHAGDDKLLAMIASRSDLEVPRHWVHYSYFGDEERARSAARAITAAGWQVQRVAAAADGEPSWIVVADVEAVTSPASVRDARQFFEGVAAAHGGEYDGWEAGVPSRPKEVPRLLRRPRRRPDRPMF